MVSILGALGLNPRLFNFSLATEVNTPVGKGLHIPVQISTRDGGRKSLYFLDPGEEVLAGVYVVNSQVYHRFVKRETGEGVPAKTGDRYTERIATPAGDAVASGTGPLQVLDETKGIGVLQLDGPTIVDGSVWVLWSCVKVEW